MESKDKPLCTQASIFSYGGSNNESTKIYPLYLLYLCLILKMERNEIAMTSPSLPKEFIIF